ncbi:hypothetical protein Taro_035221 [Colocasia esculenta]|uniref:Uncharacterized protein n=1 Tax=Colocasia esculenta TaxID=4460 RepID=A0A843WE89_COLES|nr:hypothetical protein [Colocasia esculenta]
MFVGEEVLQTLELRSLDGIRWRFSSSKCVDTTGHCVDTTGIVFKLGFWDSHLVSTPQGTVSTPQAPSFRPCFWDSHLVSTPQGTVSTPQELDGKLAAVKILSWWQHRVPLTLVGGNPLAVKFFSLDRTSSTSLSSEPDFFELEEEEEVEGVAATLRALVKKPTSWYKPQCGSARLKPLARFYTEYSPSAGQKSFLEKKEQS